VIIDLKGNRIRGERKASSEIAMHLLIYEMRPDAQAVVHAHPAHATAYAAAGIPLNKALISEVVLALGCIPLAEYGTPGTHELTDELRPFIKNYDALLMSNHGVVTYGANLEDAFNRMDTVEHFAKISIFTKILGRERLLSNEDVEKLWVQRQKYYGLEGSDAKPKDPMCPLTDGVSETISITRGELIDLIERVVSNLR
jgi:L-fuculose-phosphate aldolase